MLSELDNYLQRIEDLRQQVIDLIVDLPVEALNWRPTERIEDHATNSLAVLAAHIAGAEHFWIGEIIGGRPPTRNRPAEFTTQAASATELRRLLDQTGAETQEIFRELTGEDLNGTRLVDGRTVSVRWGVLHVIDHTALHLGHMQITYQLWQGGQSKLSPPWYERLPQDDQSL
ncbi:MAG: DinB family protein [Chloroflexota bacterium]